jgi:hypothetical protein
VISDKKLNSISIALGLLLTAYVAQDLHFNPRWYGDKGPGVGKMPREVVSGYMDLAYGKGQAAEAAKLYTTPKTIDLTPHAVYRDTATPLISTVRQVVAEGLNVVVHHCVEATRDQPAHEVVDMFRTWNGRIAWRKTLAQSLNGGTCTGSSLNKPVELGLKP